MSPVSDGRGGPSSGSEVEVVQRAADRLEKAADDRRVCQPVRDLLGTTDVSLAYAVQARLTATRVASGASIVGRKIGLTSPAVQRQLGVDQPDFGVLFDDMAFHAADEIPMSRLLQPKIEAEIAFVLAEDLVEGPLDVPQVAAAVETAHAALEVVDSRIQGWDITITDTVADNASSGLFVMSPESATLAEFSPVACTMALRADDDILSAGSGDACLGNPLAALAWLARAAREYDQPLTAGQIILSGALGPMVTVAPGATYTAEISGLGSVSATFDSAPASGAPQ
jgi:2-keto-4-pentenoate hydratase